MRIMLVLTHFGKDIYAGRLGIVQDLLFYFILMNIWVVLKSLKKNIQEKNKFIVHWCVKNTVIKLIK